MERLTEKHSKESDGYYLKCSETFSSCYRYECEHDAESVDRLGQIEDILGDTYDLDRLRELVEADKKGNLLVKYAESAEYSDEELAELTGYKCLICQRHSECIESLSGPLCELDYEHFEKRVDNDRR